MDHMNKNFIFAIIVLMTACSSTATQPTFPSAIPSNTLNPSETNTATATFTETSTPTAVTPTIIPTETPRPNIAPTLPHTNVYFITHGDREKPYVALTFDLCQKPELPA